MRSLGAALLASLIVGCVYSDSDDDDRSEGAATAPPISGQASLEAPARVEAGEQLLEQGKYDEAIDAFTRALKAAREKDILANANQAEAEVYFQRGMAYLKSGFPDTAIEDFSDAINLLPDDGTMYQQRGRAYLELGDLYNALRDATQSIRLMPDNANAYHVRGQVYLGRERPDRAVADLEQALAGDPALASAIQPELAQAYASWGEQLQGLGNAAAAEEKFARARELDPGVAIASSAAPAGEPAPAIEQTVAKPVIDDADREFASGREHQLAKAYDQAIIEYTEAIAMRPDFKEAYLRRGEVLLALGFPDSALEDLRRAANRGAASAEAHRLQARAYMALENPNRAAMSATEALHDDPTDAATYALRGEAYMQLENWGRAVADLEEAIRRAPELRTSLQSKLSNARRMQAEAETEDLRADL